MSVPPAATDELLDALRDDEGVLNLSVERGASVKPPGDVVTVHALNRSVDAVLARAARAGEHGATAIVTSGIDSVVVTGAQRAVEDDADESPWEEFERTLRHHGRISANDPVLMALGGAIAVAGLLAPAFEPVAELALALLRRSLHGIRRAVVSVIVGYLVAST